jgi:hypothetical protein
MEKRKSLVFYEDKDQHLLNHLAKQANINDYIKKLIENDINKEKNDEIFVKDNVKREIVNYTNTKAFRNLVLDMIKEYSEIGQQLAKKTKKEV